MSIELTFMDWLVVFANFMALSLLMVGGGITVAPAMHRFLVLKNGYLTDMQFTSALALAQIAPGPNVLYIALMGWNVGINAGSTGLGVMGALLTLTAVILPSAILTVQATRWARRNQQRREVRAFKQGLTPLVVALLLSTAWLVFNAVIPEQPSWIVLAFAAAALLVLLKTKIHLLWVLAVGAVLGAAGFI
jgi:chromate transporter